MRRSRRDGWEEKKNDVGVYLDGRVWERERERERDNPNR